MAEKKKSVKKYSAGKDCPKCGTGTRLASHPNRCACGKCGYCEMK